MSYTVNGYTDTRNGYMLLGNNNNSMSGGANIYTAKGAFSLLHLNGEGASFQEFGYRPWMKTGLTFTGNADLSYFGLRKLSTTVSEEDLTETVLLWSDNPDGVEGPDKMVFRFSGYGGSDGATVSSNRLSNTDLDALHVAEFTNLGLFGLGNTFGTDATGMSAAQYNTPQSLLHMSYDWRTGLTNTKFGFGQITYRRDNISTTGTGETENDGLRWGIDNTIINQGGVDHLNGYLRWQENSSFIIQSDWDNTAGGVTNGERMRFTSVGSLVNTQGSSYGGLTSPTNITRVAISHNGATPITRPKSLLHLGYNTGVSSIPAGSADGWRNWMDIGAFIGDGTDNMYVGLKNEGTDRADAVVGWGDNQVPNLLGQNGPDNLRFIFTSTTTALPPGQGDPISQSNNGLETGRFYPGADTTFTYLLPGEQRLYGRFGVGDFTASGVDENPTHKLDVIGNGRFRYLPDSLYIADSTVNKIVMVDSMGVLRWSSYVPSQFGVACSDTTINGKLPFDSKIDLNNQNFYFEKNDILGQNHVGVGYDCGSVLPGKISSIQEHPFAISTSYTNTNAGYFRNRDESETFFTQFFGVYGISDGINMYDGSRNVGGYFTANNGMQSLGVVGLGQGGKYSLGLYGEATGGTISNYGVYGTASGTDAWAGWFNGAGFLAAGAWTYSDQNLKHNIQEFQEANSILSQLNPVRYDFKTAEYPELNLSSAPQIGLIAQELEQVLPEAVRDTRTPEKRDSLGNLIAESVEFKAVSYEKLIPVLVAGHQEQQAKIEDLESKLNDLMERYERLEACLQSRFPDMCTVSQGMIVPNSSETQKQVINSIEVELSNKNAIVLNQNVPNPFAEKTVISYSIPESIGKAQIHFYDAKGILIQSIEINERGAGQLNVFGTDLSSGMYSYSLVADGKVVDTKRMVKN